MAQRSVTRQVPKLDLRADVVPSTLDKDARTIDLTWTTGARVKRGFWEPYYEELSLNPKHVRMDRLSSGNAPLLNSHRSDDLSDVIGVVQSAKIEGKRGTATVRFARSPEGEAAFQLIADGIVRNVSVGYRVHKLVKVEGGEDKVPVYRAEDWEPYEISPVPIGADAGAVTRSGGVMTNPCEFIEERAMDPEDPTATTTITAAPATPGTAAASPDAIRAAEDRETTRVLGIQRIGIVLKRSPAEITEAITKRTSLEAFRATAVDALANAAPEDGGVITLDKRDARIQPGADARDKYIRSAESWLMHRAGVAKLVAEADQKAGKQVDLDPGECRGMTLVEMARDSLERAGVRTRGMDVMQMIGLSFTHRGGGMNSTSDFPVILENVLNKTLLAAYATTPDTWRRWCVVGSVTDFRAHNRYRMGSFGVFDTVLEGGEYKQATVPDGEKNSISVGKKGRIIAITRETIINDDMNALNDLPTRLGRGAALTIEVDAYATLVMNGGLGPTMGDGVVMFHANHGNIGAAAAISVASVDADRVLMAKQKDPSGNEVLELRPRILLLPVGLGGQARVINNSQYDVDKVANARNQEPNKVVGLYGDIIDTSRLTGTSRYSITDPAINPVMECAFLNGVEQPTLEMQQGWLIDGVQYKARLEYGFAGRDWRGIVINAGA